MNCFHPSINTSSQNHSSNRWQALALDPREMTKENTSFERVFPPRLALEFILTFSRHSLLLKSPANIHVRVRSGVSEMNTWKIPLF